MLFSPKSTEAAIVLENLMSCVACLVKPEEIEKIPETCPTQGVCFQTILRKDRRSRDAYRVGTEYSAIRYLLNALHTSTIVVHRSAKTNTSCPSRVFSRKSPMLPCRNAVLIQTSFPFPLHRFNCHPFHSLLALANNSKHHQPQHLSQRIRLELYLNNRYNLLKISTAKT